MTTLLRAASLQEKLGSKRSLILMILQRVNPKSVTDASPDDTNAVTFAVKGLFGGYFGIYSLLPYYDKLKEYRDTEQRDIWEHNGSHSRYYFFTENCSCCKVRKYSGFN